MSSYNLDTPYSNQVIFLNSNNSVFRNVDGEGEYVYSFQTPIQLPINTNMLISVSDAQLPNVIPNVTASNNKISFSVPTFSKFFTVTLQEEDGNIDKVYNVTDWLSFVNAKIIIEAIGQFTLYGEYQTTTSKIKWFSNYPFQIIDSGSYPTTCYDLIGFPKNNDNTIKYYDETNDILLNSTFNPSYHITMPSVVNFAGTRFIFVKFKNVSVNNLNSNGVTDNAIVRIDNNSPYGYFIFYRPAIQQQFLISKRTINNLSFSITDTAGQALNIWSGDCQITLKLEYIYKPELRSMEQGTIQYELRKLSQIPQGETESTGIYNPETNEYVRE